MDVLAAHAREVSAAGAAFAGTGAQVHATWQGLASVYDAPEVGQLLAATGPVQIVSGSLGDDLGSVGRALGSYAVEVRAIKARLDALRADAGAFARSVQGEDDWADDDAKRERNNQLVDAVNLAVADFEAAQRRCANAINGRYGGTQYRVEDGDGQREPGEYGNTAGQYAAAAGGDEGLPWGKTETDDPGLFSSIGHGILDLAGLVPVLGEAADGANAAWYAAEGDALNASLSAAAMVPLLGWGATGAKAGIKATKALKGADEAVSHARPAGFRNGVRDKVWDNAIEPQTGGVRDPVTGRFMNKENPWDMGHRPGVTNSISIRRTQRSEKSRGKSSSMNTTTHHTIDRNCPRVTDLTEENT